MLTISRCVTHYFHPGPGPDISCFPGPGMTARQRSLLTDKMSITASSEDDVLLEDKVEVEEKEILVDFFPAENWGEMIPILTNIWSNYSGIIATSHDLTPKCSWGSEIPLFQGGAGRVPDGIKMSAPYFREYYTLARNIV